MGANSSRHGATEGLAGRSRCRLELPSSHMGRRRPTADASFASRGSVFRVLPATRNKAEGRAQRLAPDQDPPNYPIADAIASQNTVESPPNGCGPCSITCSLRRFPWESTVDTVERNPTSFTRVLL
jgi:hypothetical protein